jgi:hypothetical protein
VGRGEGDTNSRLCLFLVAIIDDDDIGSCKLLVSVVSF